MTRSSYCDHPVAGVSLDPYRAGQPALGVWVMVSAPYQTLGVVWAVRAVLPGLAVVGPTQHIETGSGLGPNRAQLRTRRRLLPRDAWFEPVRPAPLAAVVGIPVRGFLRASNGDDRAGIAGLRCHRSHLLRWVTGCSRVGRLTRPGRLARPRRLATSGVLHQSGLRQCESKLLLPPR